MQSTINHVHLDTRTFAESDRFEVWRSYFRRTFLDIPDPSRAKLFRAEGDVITSSQGVMFTAGHCEATDNYMSGDISDFILLGSILDGESFYTHGGKDAVSVTPDSGLAMLSPHDTVRISNHYHRYALIILPKALVRAQLGDDLVERERSVFTFPRSPMGQMLDGLLRLTAQKAPTFDSLASRTSLSSLIDFALATLLEEHNLQEERLPDADRAFYAAICGVISDHIHLPTLDAMFIAQRLGLSRSGLYRVLSARNQTIGQLVRRMRIDTARRLMLENPHEQIAEVAGRCGYASSAAFTRAFRRATGMAPKDWRQANINRESARPKIL